MTKNNKRFILIFLLLVIGLGVGSFFWTRSSIKSLKKHANSRLSPVIMIPGSSATENRFDSLVKKINETTNANHSLLKVKVYNNGKITFRGKIRAHDYEPIIVVGFENNKDGYNNIKKQAKMFNQAFIALQNKYSFNSFKGIAHSNGGLIYTAFLENYFYDYEDYVTIKKLMTIGTPYNFNEKNINNRSEMLADFIKHRSDIPSNLIVYSLAGTITYDSDELVPDSSVSAGKYIYQKQVEHYTEITVTGEDAQHSDLPTNDEVISLIDKYILDTANRGQNRNIQN